MRRLSPIALALVTAACSGELRQEPLSVDEIWDGEAAPNIPGEDIAWAERGVEGVYGLPREGEPGIADLIAILPTEALGVGDSDMFVSPDTGFATDQCRGGAPTVTSELPMTIEAVVTLHPRQYMKVTICGQDERHYGVYTVEDDTGGIIVLRDGRVAPFSFGDRVRMTVHAATLTFGREVDTRAVLVADVEPLPDPPDPILYRTSTEPFTTDDIGQVLQVDGYVHVEPTNLNFNSMILTSEPYSRDQGEGATGELLQCIRTCEVRCLDDCPSPEACAGICPDLCVRNESEFVEADLPVCWMIGIDAELGRRGFQPEYGSRVRVRGPVVNNFDVQMWVISPGQATVY